MRSREIILRTTRELIERHGFGAVNVSSVASAAGVSRQTVYTIFGSREELVAQAVLSVALRVLEAARHDLELVNGTCAYVVELLIAARRGVHGEPVLEALLHAQQGNPVFDEGMMGRSRQVAAELLSPLIAHDPELADAELFDSLVEVTTRLGLSIVLFESDALREEDALRRFLTRWLCPALGGAAHVRHARET